MSLEKINKKLKKNTFGNFVFLIPNILIDTANPEFQEEDYHLDKVIFLDNNLLDNLPNKSNAKDYQINEEAIVKSILGKKNNFEINIIDLFEEKENLSKGKFKYILNNYYKFIEAGLAWCEIQNAYIETPMAPSLSKRIKNIFHIQCEYFQKHLLELERSFKLKKSSNFDKSLSLKEFIMDLDAIGEKDEPDTNPSITEVGSISNNNSSIDTSNRSETNGKDDNPKLSLSNYILHDRSEDIEKVIVQNFKGEKGITFRCIIEYLVGRNALTLPSGDQQKIFNAIKYLFDHDIGKYQSMFGFEIDKAKHKTYNAVRLKFVKFLEKEDIIL